MPVMSKEDWALEIWKWENDHQDSYHSLLFDLINKADKSNIYLLTQSYPHAVEAFLEFRKARTPHDYYMLYAKTRAVVERGGSRIILLGGQK